MQMARQERKTGARVLVLTLLAAAYGAGSAGAETHETAVPVIEGFVSSKLAGAAPPVAWRKVMVATEFQGEPDPGIVAALARETEAILGAVGVEVEWGSLREVGGRTFAERLVVVRFVGECRSTPGSPTVDRGALAYTHVSDGRILPFVNVACERVSGFIRNELRTTREAGVRMLGTALARVVCHELYHVLAQTATHSEHGVAKAALTSRELTRGQLRFDLFEGSMMVEGLRAPKPGRRVLIHAGM
jgi:hypothetical protein